MTKAISENVNIKKTLENTEFKSALLEQIDYCPKKEHKKIPPKTQNEVREGIQNMIVQPAETSFFYSVGFHTIYSQKL